MLRIRVKMCLIIIVLFILYSYIKFYSRERNEEKDVIKIALVVCGKRLKESLVMMKSAIVFQFSTPLHFVILADYDLQIKFDNILNTWRKAVDNSFSFELHNLSFPKDTADEWKNLFEPCAAQRLFLPDVLTHLDSVLYVDTDTIFLNNLTDIWSHLNYMNESHVVALTPEHEDPSTGWYNRFARHPYYGELGVNSGVMLMNLTRMRMFNWVSHLDGIYKKYKNQLTWGDQDIINIIFHYHPEKLYVYPCYYNYRPDHCMYMSVCKSSEGEGITVLHGSRGAFHSDKQPLFKIIYEVMNEYRLTSDPYTELLIPLISRLNETPNTGCGSVKHIFVKNMKKYFRKK